MYRSMDVLLCKASVNARGKPQLNNSVSDLAKHGKFLCLRSYRRLESVGSN